jgi:hypothetical protein
LTGISQAEAFRSERFDASVYKSVADCMTAAYDEGMPLDTCEKH